METRPSLVSIPSEVKYAQDQRDHHWQQGQVNFKHPRNPWSGCGNEEIFSFHSDWNVLKTWFGHEHKPSHYQWCRKTIEATITKILHGTRSTCRKLHLEHANKSVPGRFQEVGCIVLVPETVAIVNSIHLLETVRWTLQTKWTNTASLMRAGLLQNPQTTRKSRLWTNNDWSASDRTQLSAWFLFLDVLLRWDWCRGNNKSDDRLPWSLFRIRSISCAMLNIW